MWQRKATWLWAVTRHRLSHSCVNGIFHSTPGVLQKKPAAVFLRISASIAQMAGHSTAWELQQELQEMEEALSPLFLFLACRGHVMPMLSE